MRPVTFYSSPQLGSVVRAERESRSLAQAELAEQAGVTRQWLVRLETGRLTNPTLQNVLRVLDSLGLDLTVGPRASRNEPDLGHLMGRL
ncbi:helix-turn-helix transcriptional regulator [Nocardia sp. NPDC059177]|uniref:helix-turn-helix transcriptional regulator n=1 Tax=Nocardia sp. NPDC059177 TaxID=3346759 RepID=UPI0036AAF4CE